MPRSSFIALAAAAALAVAGCGTSACQELGVKLCECQPGMTKDTCTSQVQAQLNDLGVDSPGLPAMLDKIQAGKTGTFEVYCQERLDKCVAPSDTSFCEWILTADGKNECGLTPKYPAQ